jgi:hypothetical protein
MVDRFENFLLYERKAMAKSVPRIPATEETPMAVALLEVEVAPAAEEDLVLEPELPELPVDVEVDAPVGVGRPV